jgi:aminoglycoside phosphotransferase (APT) family kinase protein
VTVAAVDRSAELLRLPVEDVAARIAALLATVPGAADVEVVDVRRTFGGNARRAWSFTARWTTDGGVRTVPGIMLSQVERAQVDGDLGREFALLRGLEAAGVRTPAAIALDASGDVVGAPSMLLERLPGEANAVRLLRTEDVPAGARLTRQLAELGARLHAFDWRSAGLHDVLGAATDDPHEAAAQQVEAWFRTFRAARFEPTPALAAVFGWLLDHVPPPPRCSVVHGDFRPGNFLYRDGEITGLLDWELAHVGDPIEDVAWAYRDFWSPERLLPLDAFVAEYERHGGPRVTAGHLRYYRIFTEAKFATISLRGARAFRDGRTTNLRLADRAATVVESTARCLAWIDESEGERTGA